MRKHRGDDKGKDASRDNGGKVKSHRSLKEIISLKLHRKKKNKSVKAGPIPVENCAKLPEDDGCYANPPPSSVEIVAEVNASVERNDPPSRSEFGKNSDADVMKPTGHSVGDPTTTANDWNEIKEDILDDYANPCEVSGTEVNAMTTNVTQSGGALATDTDNFDDGRGNFPEVNQTCEPELSHKENPTPKYAAESPSSSPIEHFGEPSTVNTRESDVAEENSPEAFLSSEAKPHSELSSAPNLTTQFAPPPTTNTREHREDFPKADLHPTAKTSANVIYTTPQISSAVPASTENHKVTTSVKSSESESKSKPQSDRDDGSNEQLSFGDRKKLFENKDSASCLQSTNRAVKTPLTGSAKPRYQSSVVQPSVDEKSKKGSKSASSSATAASSSSFSPKRSPGNCKSVNKKDDNDSDSDSDDDDDDDDDDDSSSDSEPSKSTRL